MLRMNEETTSIGSLPIEVVLLILRQVDQGTRVCVWYASRFLRQCLKKSDLCVARKSHFICHTLTYGYTAQIEWASEMGATCRSDALHDKLADHCTPRLIEWMARAGIKLPEMYHLYHGYTYDEEFVCLSVKQRDETTPTEAVVRAWLDRTGNTRLHFLMMNAVLRDNVPMVALLNDYEAALFGCHFRNAIQANSLGVIRLMRHQHDHDKVYFGRLASCHASVATLEYLAENDYPLELDLAVEFNSIEAVVYLLESGCAPTDTTWQLALRNERAAQILNYACERGYLKARG